MFRLLRPRPLRRPRRSSRGDSAVEFALLAPALLLLAVGSFDIGHIIADTGVIAGQERAGIRAAVKAAGSDVGFAIRNEAEVNPSGQAYTWGPLDTGQAGSCAAGSTTCGDPSGCPVDFFTNNPSANACFAVGTCTLAAGSPATCNPTWGAAPTSAHAANVAVAVRVVQKIVPSTPLISHFATSGAFYVTRTVWALPQY